LLDDFTKGRLKREYRQKKNGTGGAPGSCLANSVKKLGFGISQIMTTRGCPYSCDFCCSAKIFGNRFRHVPVDHVVEALARTGDKFIFVTDDNIIGDVAYATRLFAALKSLGVRWIGQASLLFAGEKLLKLAADSGCLALLFGLESVARESSERYRKLSLKSERLEDAIKRIQGHGIFFHPSLIFGFDTDTPSVFPRTLEFLFEHRIFSASLSVLTPYPGTRVHDRLRRAGRILTRDWKYYNSRNVVFRPQHMSPLDLALGKLWVTKEFHKISSILKRMPALPKDDFITRFLLFAVMNWGCRNDIKQDVRLLKEGCGGLYADETAGGRDMRKILIRKLLHGARAK
jgi:radical SAM superfamily enzyme YgiQ (UPF0313 family)